VASGRPPSWAHERHFFPGPLFAWAFLGGLLAILAVAAFIDLRRMAVPKSITIPALALGLVFNLIRGAWLGALDNPVWVLGTNGSVVGAADGLLFALTGFLVGFGMFFLMWILGVCGGGDVKLFAAVGTWVGAYLAILVLCTTIVVVVVMVWCRLLFALLTGEWKTIRKSLAQRQPRRGAAPLQPKKRALGFSLPLVIATLLVLLWAFRVDLHVVPTPVVTAAQVHQHGR